MKNIIIFCFICLYSNLLVVHETNEAFFIITEKENTIEIKAELPWTMRNALIAYNPSLKNTTSNKDFEDTFIEYIKANLILKNNTGNLLKFKNYTALDNNGHSHQNSYLIVFSGSDLIEVTNTIMFNINKNQVNYNNLIINSKTYKTSKSSNHFKLNQKNVSDNWYFFFLIVPLLFLVNKYYQKTIANKSFNK